MHGGVGVKVWARLDFGWPPQLLLCDALNLGGRVHKTEVKEVWEDESAKQVAEQEHPSSISPSAKGRGVGVAPKWSMLGSPQLLLVPA